MTNDSCTAIKYKDWCEENDFSFSDITSGTVTYDFTNIASIFDRFYANFFIVDPSDDFAEELQLTYDLAKERIDGYYDFVTNNFNPKGNTVMTVDYGERETTGKDYTYPVSGDTDSSPNSAVSSVTEAVSDTTTVTKDTDPFDTLDRVKAMQSFNEYFIAQFKECFTLISGVTW